ncbi:hypothetical protein Hanom_Chr00s001284g01678951 [Helianthus anomalus]
MFVDEKGDYKAFIAKIVREPDIFTTWIKSIGVTVKSVVSDESSCSGDDSVQSSDESELNDVSSVKEVVFDQTPSVSDVSDVISEKSAKFDHSPVDSSSDDEEEKHINVAKSHLSPESFHFYFADRMEKLKAKRVEKEHMEMKTDCVNEENVKAEQIVEEKMSEDKKWRRLLK